MKSTMKMGFCVAVVAAGLLVPGAAAQAATYEVTTRADIVFAEHDGVKLLGDLYSPKGLDKAPVLVAVHGGGWQVGSRKFYTNWGPYLAKNGIAVFAIEYRLMKPGVKTYPGAVYDTKAAVQYVRAKAAELGVDPERIGMIGDSAGGHLVGAGGAGRRGAALLQRIPLRSERRGVVQGEGRGRLLRRLRHAGAVSARPGGAAARQHRREVPRRRAAHQPQGVLRASPISYATVDKNSTRFLLIHGTDDDIVDPPTQSIAFLNALNQASFLVRRVIIPGPGTSSSPIRSTTRASAALPGRGCCGSWRTSSSENERAGATPALVIFGVGAAAQNL